MSKRILVVEDQPDVPGCRLLLHQGHGRMPKNSVSLWCSGNTRGFVACYNPIS